ncbi:PEP-CTERM sorting domain-containing protein [Phormidium tenue FACHB-886]|nr:PEP-CTERM sorting domain-containing protein [Phormidium tenue FACHB-886]
MTNFVKQLSAPNPTSNAMFWNVLTSSFPTGWNFQSAGGTPLYGTFDVRTYRACSKDIACDGLTFDRVGTELDLHYTPNLDLGDPDPNTGRVRWIQWVRDNHSLSPDEHGVPESIIDVTGSHGTPYYYAKSESFNKQSPYQFFDTPARDDIDFQHDWIAQLFLAVESPQSEGSTTRTVTLYGGIEWGWFNRVVRRNRQPVPAPYCPPTNSSAGGNCSPDDPPSDPPSGLCFVSGTPGYYEACPDVFYAASFATQDFTSNGSKVKSVPEPTSTLALLAVGVWGGVSWRKRRGERKFSNGNITQ